VLDKTNDCPETAVAAALAAALEELLLRLLVVEPPREGKDCPRELVGEDRLEPRRRGSRGGGAVVGERRSEAMTTTAAAFPSGVPRCGDEEDDVCEAGLVGAEGRLAAVRRRKMGELALWLVVVGFKAVDGVVGRWDNGDGLLADGKRAGKDLTLALLFSADELRLWRLRLE
jgi:hypothetical protein